MNQRDCPRHVFRMTKNCYMFSSFSLLKKLDWLIISAIFILTITSILMVYSTTHQNSGWHMAQKQLLFYAIGFLVMIGLSLVDYRIFREHSWILITFYFIAIATLIGLLFFGTTIRGSRSWYNLGFFNFEPIELIKLVMVFILAKYFSSRHIEMYRVRHILISGLYLAIPVTLALKQPDFGSVIILGFIWLGIMIISGIKWRHFATLGIAGIGGGVLAWFFLFKDYQKARLLSFLDPYKDPLGAGYNIIQSKIAIGNGGLWGRGLAQGPQTQLGFLPEAHNDFIFAALSEEWGLIGAIILLSIFAFLFWRILKVCLQSQNNFARLFALGYLLLIFIQVAINISTNLGLLPITGIVLPFISYGGSNLLINFIGLGILQSIIIRQKLGYRNEELNIE